MLLSRRRFLQTAAAIGAAAVRIPAAEPPRKAMIAITLDLEMSAQYPKPGMTEWNYEKGNLDEPTKAYATAAGKLVKDRGGVLHYFCVGRVLEQPNIEWLKELHAAGHPIGNHTYDHVYVLAQSPAETQFRFQRSPWLVEGMSTAEIIERNVRVAHVAMTQRAGITVNGFRTPGGFALGLAGRPDVQELLLGCGYRWVSSKYPRHETGEPGQEPSAAVYHNIMDAQAAAQPFVYPTGLVEIPMSPISDVNAFRSNHWKLDWFLEAIRQSVTWAIDNGAVFDFLAHPSCLVVEDPEMASIRLICDLVQKAGDRAQIVGLDRIAAAYGVQ
ncbi:MAG: chitin deacetylase [Planctomycetales bacterium 12-60-4]|nr:MAG: chitin deacetylase [Planctomycetales bacterium 12-60-4]